MPLTSPGSVGPRPESSGNVVVRASTFLGFFRWAFMPLGLFALVAVGVHAAADAVDDQLLWVVDHADAVLDGWLARWAVTEPLVNFIGMEQRTIIARTVTLVLELATDLVLALPALGYREEEQGARRVTLVASPRRWVDVARRAFRRPSLSTLVRPPVAALVVVVGAAAVARMVQGAMYLSLRQGVVGDEFAGPISRLLALAVLAATLGTLGWRAVLRVLQHADRLADEHSKSALSRLLAGWLGTAIALPIGLEALLQLETLAAFFR